MALDPVVQNQGYQQLLDILFGDIEFLNADHDKIIGLMKDQHTVSLVPNIVFEALRRRAAPDPLHNA